MTVRSRTRARELALQALFFMDMQGRFTPEAADLFCDNYPPPTKSKAFLEEVLHGVIHRRSEIDQVVGRFSSNWRLGRMSCVDRNALRIAVYELLHRPDIPPKVTINEAVNLGKRFGTEESGAFINGILDSIRMAFENGELQPPQAHSLS